MEQVFQNIQSAWEQYGPNVVYAIIILVVTYLVALLVKWLLGAGIDKIPFVTKANEKDVTGKTIGSSIGSAGFWIVILIGLVMALEKLGLTSVSNSIRGTVDTIFAYLPQIIGAILTFFIFFIVARVAKQATVATLAAAQADAAPEKIGLAKGPVKVTSMAGTIVFALILIPGAIAALNVLDIEAITGPTVAMLNEVTGAIPNIFVAVIVISLFALIAKFVTDLLKKVLPNTGLDSAVEKTGLLKGADAGVTPSNIIATIAGLIILLLGLIQGTYTLGFDPLNHALDIVLQMGAQILFGSVIIFAGVLISGIVASAIKASGDDTADMAAGVMRWIIVILSVILGVSRMGLDPSGEFITTAALILLIGASLAGGLAFGLGGKEWAARQLDKLNK
ncbi:MAG: hypothetical protein CME88_04545 [Hirschia sp.]|nr:hypothetical protein [Hirschia sp.]MBF17630.1 hypothetical protein [Hirschia sp.]